MPDSLPDLAGVVTKDLVDTIGSGTFKASYVNWSRTIKLLREHAPGWLPEVVPTAEGSLVHRDPIGGHLMMRFRHLDGTTTPEIPQAIMDHRNASVPFDKITSRDVSDTHRRGACLAAAMTFGLAYELWAKMPLESGYGDSAISESTQTTAQVAEQVTEQVTEQDFLETALSKGLSTHSAEALLKVINGNYANGVKTLGMKNAAWVEEQNRKNAPPQEEPAKTATTSRAKKTTLKPPASDY